MTEVGTSTTLRYTADGHKIVSDDPDEDFVEVSFGCADCNGMSPEIWPCPNCTRPRSMVKEESS